MTENYKVADIGLAERGRLQIEWAEARMPVLMALREQMRQTLSLIHISEPTRPY